MYESRTAVFWAALYTWMSAKDLCRINEEFGIITADQIAHMPNRNIFMKLTIENKQMF